MRLKKSIFLGIILISIILIQNCACAVNAFERYNKGCQYQGKGMYKEAIDCYNRAIEQNPGYVEAYLRRGNCYGKLKEFSKAIDDFNKVIELNPRHAMAYNNRGAIYSNLGEDSRAMDDYNKTIKLNPRHKLAYYNRGNVYRILKEYSKAMDDYNKAIELYPGCAMAYKNRATIHWINGSFKNVINDYEEAIKIQPDNKYLQILCYIAKDRVGENEKESLIKFYESHKDGKWPEPVIEMLLGNITPEKCIESASSNNPKTDREQKCEAYFYIGEFYLINNDKAKAKGFFEKCINTGVKNLFEFGLAKVELEKLKE